MRDAPPHRPRRLEEKRRFVEGIAEQHDAATMTPMPMIPTSLAVDDDDEGSGARHAAARRRGSVRSPRAARFGCVMGWCNKTDTKKRANASRARGAAGPARRATGDGRRGGVGKFSRT